MENLRQDLSRVLRERMEKTLSLNTQVKVAQKSQLAQSTIQRILKCEQAATVDAISDLADAFKVRPAKYFLLTSEESELLMGFARLDQNDRQKLLTFIDIAGQARFVQDARSQLNFEQEQPVPADLRAATARASSRAPSDKTHLETNVTQSNPTEKRRKA